MSVYEAKLIYLTSYVYTAEYQRKSYNNVPLDNTSE